ncbi:MAG: hypothetical protein ACP6IQ_02575 [Candidatus Njordarchaeia archaeon]
MTVYWLIRLNIIHDVFAIITLVLGLITIAVIIFTIISYVAEDGYFKDMFKVLCVCLFIFIISLIVFVFTPLKKELPRLIKEQVNIVNKKTKTNNSILYIKMHNYKGERK